MTEPWKNNILVNKHINKMFIISARKSNLNPADLYSMLKPDTNSLSPSAKSNGARLVSEIIVINHITSKGKHVSSKGNLPGYIK